MSSTADILAPFALDSAELFRLQATYQTQLRKGLSTDAEADVRGVPMLPSFLPELPTGEESGKYLALDLGGTNLRVLCCELSPGKPIKTTGRNFVVSKEAMTGPGSALFDLMAAKVGEFLAAEGIDGRGLSLGFVFSFPCRQTRLDSATLLWWTKDYCCTGVIGEDVVALLQSALDRKNLGIRVAVIMNDTVGSLASAAYHFGPTALIAGVISTGCNVSYLEKTSNITKLGGCFAFPNMVVDTEWEEFGNEGQLDEVETEFDRRVNAAALHHGRQTQDKYIAGLFLGELVRELMLALLGTGEVATAFGAKGSFPTELVGRVLKDDPDSEFWKHTAAVLAELNVPDPSLSVAPLLHSACSAVSRRSCDLLAVALSALVKHIGKKEGLIGLGGSVFKHHPTYKARLEKTIGDLAPSYAWRVVEVEDGSGKGAALVAAVAARLGPH